VCGCFAKWLLTHDPLGTWDSGGSNIYLTKKDRGSSLLEMGTVWDFDSIFRNSQNYARIHLEGIFYFPELLKHEEFVEAYRTIFNEIKNQVIVDLQSKFDAFNADGYNSSIVTNGARWGKETRVFEQNTSSIINFFDAQIAWLDEQL
jgi:hypothetical protein